MVQIQTEPGDKLNYNINITVSKVPTNTYFYSYSTWKLGGEGGR